MNSNPSPEPLQPQHPPLPPSPPPDNHQAAPGEGEGGAWRLIAWALFVTILTAGIVLPICVKWLSGTFPQSGHSLVLVLPIVVAIGVIIGLTWLGWRCRWATRRWRWWSYGVLVGAPVWLVAVFLLWWVPHMHRGNKALLVLARLRQIDSAAEQFFGEHPDRIFVVNYDDLIGPERYLRSAEPVMGEDYRTLFPIRRDQTDQTANLVVVLPDGRKVAYQFPYPFPKIEQPDGIRQISLSGGRRFEITYRGGVPDGPVRAFYADGKLWGEATYVAGKLLGRHVVFDEAGRIIYETVFSPPNR